MSSPICGKCGYRFTGLEAAKGRCPNCKKRDYDEPISRTNDYHARRSLFRILGSVNDILLSNRQNRRRRRIKRLLPIALTLGAGAAFFVLAVYPILPDQAQSWIIRMQERINELATWVQTDQ